MENARDVICKRLKEINEEIAKLNAQKDILCKVLKDLEGNANGK